MISCFLVQNPVKSKKVEIALNESGYSASLLCDTGRISKGDGQPHFYAEANEYDRERDLFLVHFEVLVLRFVNRWVFENPEGVLGHVRKHFGWVERKRNACGGGFYTPSPLRGTPPLQGESF